MAKAKDRLFDHAILVPDDRNFEEQMADLGVTVERSRKMKAADPSPKTTVKPVTPWLIRKRPGKQSTFEGLKLTKASLLFAPKIVEKIAAVSEDKVPRVALRVVEYEGTKALAFDYDPQGYAISTLKRCSSDYRITTEAVIKALHAAGLQLGIYAVRKVSGGGYLAVPE